MKIKYIALCLLLALVGCQRDEEMEIGQVSIGNEHLEASYSSVEISCSFQTNVTIKNVQAYLSTEADFSSAKSYSLSEKSKNTFGATIEGLKDASTYFVRYEVSNRWSSKMIDEVSEFKTMYFNSEMTIPAVTTTPAIDISYSSATVGGSVIDDGGIEVTERGVVYSTNQSPTTENSKVTSGSGLGEFTCNLIDLQDGTTYYVRAYAVNAKGTAYGEEVSFTTTQLNGGEGFENGYMYVDLGLSVKWATCNVGASKPEEYGDYFAWGETQPDQVYDWEEYRYAHQYMDGWVGLLKYCTDERYGDEYYYDDKTMIDLMDDAAYMNRGGNWRMPTNSEFIELLEQCAWTWTTQNGVNGYKVTSKSNGNSIFLPAAGYRDGSSLRTAGSDGNYWSSSLNTSDPYNAWSVDFNSSNVYSKDYSRAAGLSIRPVLGEPNEVITLPIVTTSNVTQITKNSAVVIVNVTNDGGSPVYDRGVVYGTIKNPTTSDEKIQNGSGLGIFRCNLTSLQPNTTYYVRAYAANSKGMVYGNEVSFITNEQSSKPNDGTENGYAYVDLGLSVKWATCNVGASKPEESGDYFAWGEVEPKEVYSWSTYKWCYGSETSLSKYCTEGTYGTVDNKTILELIDDAAHVNWGGSWRMPTDAELTELREQCTWSWTTQNGVMGYKVTNKSSGNSIFLPAAGYHNGSSLYDAGSYGGYWSSSISLKYPVYPWILSFLSDDVYSDSWYRYVGFSVRPVCP